MLNSLRAIFLAVLINLLPHTNALADRVVLKTIVADDFSRREALARIGVNLEQANLLAQDCPPLMSVETRNVGRKAIELVLLCQAFIEADLNPVFNFITSGNSSRQKLDFLRKNADLVSHTFFRSSLDDPPYYRARSFLVTSSVIGKGQFEVGLFTTPARLAEVSAKLDQQQWRTLKGATVLSWKVDVSTMQALGLSEVFLLPGREAIWRNINHGRADFTFSALNRKVVNQGGELLRIDGYKVALLDERVFIVNKNRPDLYLALQRFIAKLETNDGLAQVFEHAGVSNRHYRDWQLLYSQHNPVEH